ncbi:MAG: prolyl-tRNA synthetase [Patescibacteria group bacterium]|nr:prolyl-tRNA synthetase [Patescibacteria group bacterium]
MEGKTYENKIVPRSEDYSEWYLSVIAAADLATYSPVKGCMIIKPNGYAIWEKVQEVLNKEFKKKGVQNAYFPMLIPEKLLTREAQHVEGFAPEVAVVTHAGGAKLDEPLVLRPTSETIMYEVFKDWIHSYRDLPLLINQWANVIRWEMKTKPFLRTTEFLWQEGHTVHKDEPEADAYARTMLGVYEKFFADYMAIPIIPGVKSESEKFAGALRTYTCEAMMQDGKALQISTSHNLGDNFAKAFDIKFLNEENNEVYGWQTSWGLSTRSIGGLIMTHSDDKGLVLPPKMASIQVVIVPIIPNPDSRAAIESAAMKVAESLGENISVHVDVRDMRHGEKYFDWEKKGIPVRIEIGPKDIEKNSVVIVRRDTGDKEFAPMENLVEKISDTLEKIQSNLYDRALAMQNENTVTVTNWDEFTAAIEDRKFVMAHWDGTDETEKSIKDEIGATIRCIPFDSVEEEGSCVKTGKPSTRRVLFAKAH